MHARPKIKTASRTNKKAFSLIELLVAITIIAILLGLSIAVGGKILGASNDKTTKTNMAIIMNAIETYHDEFDCYPGPNTLASDRTVTFGDIEDIVPKHYEIKPITSRHLWGEDAANVTPPKSRDKIKNLSKDAIKNRKVVGNFVEFNFADGYGTQMRYAPNGGLGGTPVLISAGKDKKFGKVRGSDGNFVTAGTDSDREKYGEDDIRSDR